MTASPDWFAQNAKAWSKAQQDYWNNWFKWTQSGANYAPWSEMGGLSGADNWAEGLKQWQQMFAPKPANPLQDYLDRILEMGKSYAGFAESFFNAKELTGNAEEAVKQWLSMLQDSFNTWKNQLEKGLDVEMPNIGAFNTDSMKAWQDMAAAAFSNLGGMDLPNFHSGLNPDSGMAREQLIKLLGTPALGFSREKQEKWQELGSLMVEYQQAMLAYKMAFAKTGVKTVEELRKRLSKLEQPIDSVRGLYDFWVEVSEDVYGKFAISDEYQVVYGDMVNAFMAVKQASNALAEDNYRAMHLPTRTEMEALAERLQQSRRENRKLRKQLATIDKRLAALEAGGTPPAAAAPVEASTAKDDLTQIKGIGPKMQEQLYEQGITAFSQLASMNKQAIEDLEETIKSSGRIARENWVKQAMSLLSGN